MKTLKARAHDESGFTLIELMVVVLIIGILIAAALPVMLGARIRAQDRAAQADLRTAVGAAKVVYTDGTTYTGFTGGVGGTATAIEPSLIWIGASDPGPTSAISITVASGDDLLIVRRSASGRYFCIADRSNLPGYSTGNGNAYADVDTQAECLNGW